MLHKTLKSCIWFTLFLLLAACAPFTAPQPAGQAQPAATIPPEQANPTNIPAGQVSPGQTSNQSSGTSQAAATSAAPQAGPAVAPVFLHVLSPQDGDTVNTPQVKISGEASVGAVVSINDDILVVGPDQRFEAQLGLMPGSNLVEIVASDANGNEIDQILTVFYEQ